MPSDANLSTSATTKSIVFLIAMIILILYILSPIDIIPDIIPVIGWIDDMIALAGVVMLGMALIE